MLEIETWTEFDEGMKGTCSVLPSCLCDHVIFEDRRGGIEFDRRGLETMRYGPSCKWTAVIVEGE